MQGQCMTKSTQQHTQQHSSNDNSGTNHAQLMHCWLQTRGYSRAQRLGLAVRNRAPSSQPAVRNRALPLHLAVRNRAFIFLG